jgi:prephenate dehydratase
MKLKSKNLAYLGPEGTHTEQACIAYNSSANRIPFASIKEAAKSINL